MRPKLSIVVPCYNEEKNLPLLIRRFKKVISSRDGIEVVLVDNGSLDGSKKVLKRLLKNSRGFRVVEVKKNKGYGFGILSGLRKARGEYLGWTHADLQTDPSDVLKAYDVLYASEKPETTFVKGRRKNRPFVDKFFTLGMSVFETLILRTCLFDINAQPNIFHSSLMDKMKSPPNDFSLDLFVYYFAKRNGFIVKRIDVLFPDRIHGESSWNTSLCNKWKFIKRTIDFTFKMKKRLRRGV